MKPLVSGSRVGLLTQFPWHSGTYRSHRGICRSLGGSCSTLGIFSLIFRCLSRVNPCDPETSTLKNDWIFVLRSWKKMSALLCCLEHQRRHPTTCYLLPSSSHYTKKHWLYICIGNHKACIWVKFYPLFVVSLDRLFSFQNLVFGSMKDTWRIWSDSAPWIYFLVGLRPSIAVARVLRRQSHRTWHRWLFIEDPRLPKSSFLSCAYSVFLTNYRQLSVPDICA